MAGLMSRENRLRLFLAFLILVLVLVNTQSLQVSHRSSKLLAAAFSEAARARAELVAARLAFSQQSDFTAEELQALSRSLSGLAQEAGLASACLVDLNGRLLAGSTACRVLAARDYDRLDRRGRLEVLERGWAMTEVDPPYDPERASAFGYLALRRPEGSFGSVLRVEFPARSLAELNRDFRATLLYQVSALSLVLLAIFLFLNSFLAPHRRLVAEARSVAGHLAAPVAAGDEGQFLLATFQTVVTRLKEKERQLAEMHRREKERADETEALATDIIRSMTTGLVSVDSLGRVALVNPAAERIFEAEAAGLAGRPFSEALHGSELLAGWVTRAVSAGEFALRRRVGYRRETGETVHLGVSVIPLVAAEARIRGALCLFADLTEVIELRERLFLKENLARLGEMAAGIAHEFRNSLATILGNAKLLKQSLPDGQAPLVDALLEEGTSLSRVVSDFLHFARPETLRPERFDLFQMANDLARDLKPLAAGSGVRLALEGAPCEIEADEALVRKALSNLMRNAIEAAASEVQIAAGVEASQAFVRVTDNGRGIAREHLPRIFAPFFTTKPQGTGLGLALAQKIAVSHNGQVEVRSEPGKGASFTLRLPLRPEPSPMDEWV